MKTRNLTTKSGEAREITAEIFKTFRPLQEINPTLAAALAKRKRGPQKAPTKVAVTVRLDPDIVDFYKTEGAGWQSRLNADLAALVKSRRRVAAE